MKQLLGMTENELKIIMEEIGEKGFRAKQLLKWLTSLTVFEEMSNLPQSLREKLAKNYSEGYAKLHTTLKSSDGTCKYLFELEDEALVECVLMKYSYGNTLCISTQVGCAMGCAFCASGVGGKQRNMTVAELLYQVLAVNKMHGEERSVTNVVLMGTGEPLDNYENIVGFLRRLHSDETLGVSYRNISLSTCGITPMIERFTGEEIPLNLCLSLHSAISEKRLQIMPIEKAFPFKGAVDAISKYSKKTGRRVIFEYILIKDFNDTQQDIAALCEVCRDIICHINIIPYNGGVGDYEKPTEKQCRAFAHKLEKAGISATLRRTLGDDIDGACGQLRSRVLKDAN